MVRNKKFSFFGASSFYWRVMDRSRTIHSRAPRYSFSLNAHLVTFCREVRWNEKFEPFLFSHSTFFTLSSGVTGNFTYNLLAPLHDLFLCTTVSTVHCTNTNVVLGTSRYLYGIRQNIPIVLITYWWHILIAQSKHATKKSTQKSTRQELKYHSYILSND